MGVLKSFARQRRWLLLGLALLVLAATFRIGWRIYPLLEALHPPRIPLTAAHLANARESLGLVEAVSFKTTDGLTLRGWYTPSRNGAVVIFVHGSSSNRAWFIPEGRELVKRGMGVLMFDSRACGESDGELQSWGDHERLDVQAAIDFVSARPDVRPGRIGIEGFSIGATAASLVVAHDTRVKAVVLNAIWPSLKEELVYKSSFPKPLTTWLLFQAYAKAGVRIDQVHPAKVLASIAPRPLVIVEGELDRDTPLANSRDSFAAAAMPKEFWLIPGADHGDYVRKDQGAYMKRFGDFFARHLLAEGAETGLQPVLKPALMPALIPATNAP